MRNLAFAVVLILMSSCNVFLETDVSQVVVTMKAPTNNLSTNQEAQTFWWDYVTGATFYNIQIVSPSFDSIQQLVTDSEVTENIFEFSLPPGQYEWTVIAYNDSYVSQSDIFTLTVEADSTLDNQTILLVSPNNTTLNDNPVRLLWQTLSAANQYQVQVATPDFSNSTFIITDENTTNDYLDVLNLMDDTYQWRVKGINTYGETSYTSGTFTIDRTAPTPTVLNSPSDGTNLFLNSNIDLNWTSAIDAIQDTLFIIRDLGTSDETVLTLPTTVQSYTFVDSTSTTNQTYFWKVKSIDEVGNVSTSSAWIFYLQ